MSGADIAACLIREGHCPQAAIAAAARRTGERYKDIQKKMNKRNANAALRGGEAVPSNGVVRPCLKCGATPKHGTNRAGLHEMRCACGNHVAFHLTEARAIEVWNWSNATNLPERGAR